VPRYAALNCRAAELPNVIEAMTFLNIVALAFVADFVLSS
jgi:hypothetical protein